MQLRGHNSGNVKHAAVGRTLVEMLLTAGTERKCRLEESGCEVGSCTLKQEKLWVRAKAEERLTMMVIPLYRVIPYGYPVLEVC